MAEFLFRQQQKAENWLKSMTCTLGSSDWKRTSSKMSHGALRFYPLLWHGVTYSKGWRMVEKGIVQWWDADISQPKLLLEGSHEPEKSWSPECSWDYLVPSDITTGIHCSWLMVNPSFLSVLPSDHLPDALVCLLVSSVPIHPSVYSVCYSLPYHAGCNLRNLSLFKSAYLYKCGTTPSASPSVSCLV